jgi:hypothetical protein
MAYFLCVLGLVLVLEGLPYFISPDLVKKLAQQLESLPGPQLRSLGLVMALAGLGVIWLGRHLGG